MTTSELITPAHLARKALIYVRQSTLQQVLTNQESLHLQYALRLRALELGWRPEDIEIIDCDLGQTAAVAQNRAGFKEVVSRVTLGEVGILLSSEVTRLSRNCSDWYPLLDICGYRQCLIADRDGIYDPASTNGRLLLGLKGQLSEFELHTIRSRLTAGLLNKAERGDLGLPLPMGLLRLADGQVVKDPNVEVQERLGLVFSTFLRVKSASQVLRFFNEQQLRPAPPGSLWRCGVETAHRRRPLGDFKEPHLCWGIRLRSQPNQPRWHGQAENKAFAFQPMEDHRPGQVSRLSVVGNL